MTAHRFLGFDVGDWTILTVAMAVIASLTFLAL
jgi:hypothetical protein